MADRAAFEAYLAALRKASIKDKTEHMDRSALEALLETFAARAEGKPVVHQEPKRKAGIGAPDFKIVRKGLIQGYVETKAIGTDLKQVAKSDQIKRYYKDLSQNLLLTDYLEFVWINKDGQQQRAVLCGEDALENRKARLTDEAIAATAAVLEAFLSSPPQKIADSRALAEELARRSRLLRDYLSEELIRQEKEHQEGRLYGLFLTFRDQVFHELTLKDFADAFAQMLAYGLFLARLNSGSKAVTLNNAREFVPGSFRLIRELVDFLNELEKDEYLQVRWVVEEVLSIVNGMDLAAIHESLSFRQRRAISRRVRAQDEEEHRLFERDPFIYFYEDYLKAYDKDTRKGRGVYYTPPPIVNFIIRAIDDILKDRFEIGDGLADHKRVTVLDFACGTGTFLLEVFQRIFDNIGGPDAAVAGKVVREHILKNLYGFEYLIAPYTIAHLKLSQYLKDKGHPLSDKERLQVFLTNTLEPIEPQPSFLLPAVTAEVKAAQEVKKKPILVITGNPPYSGHSKNKGEWISAAIDGYKFTVETDESGREFIKPLGERNPKWLNDDYVKFIRFAQLKMDVVEEGIVGIITNHSWLDNPTFRGMRQSLMRSFQQIYVLDLHGSTTKEETSAAGDENVFDIKQGVAISIFVKRSGLERGIWRGDLHGRRLKKYEYLAGKNLATVAFANISPRADLYLFAATDVDRHAEYSRFEKITKIFPVSVLGFQTHRDAFAIGFERSDIENRIAALRDTSLSDSHLAKIYELKDNRDWKLSEARKKLRAVAGSEQIVECDYRPFDKRWCHFGYETMDYPRRELLANVLRRQNLCLEVSRQVRSSDWRHIFISSDVPESCLVSLQSREGNYALPMMVYGAGGSRENLSPGFRAFLDSRYDHHYSPEEILGYIYAVLHAPAYRSRYAEFLRIDFPRIPFPDDAGDFEALSKLGWALVEAHLLRAVPAKKLARYHGKGDDTVEVVRYAPAEQAVWINQGQCFKPVPEAVWNFRIGGYQVLDKYLKSRKSRILSLDEITHVGQVADALAFTIAQMAKIDQAYAGAFPGRG